MKCKKCHVTMEKDIASRTATCPNCGRTVSYRTKADKKAYSGVSDVDLSGCLKVIGIIALIVILVPLLLLSAIFGDGFWGFLGGILDFIFDFIWKILGFVFQFLGAIVSGFFDMLFH